MNILLIILAVIATPIVIVLVAALFIKKEANIQRSIVIDRPKQDVFDYVKIMLNQEKFSKWVMTDPNKKTSSKGTDGTLGFCYAWEGNKQAGKGEQEIVALKEGELVDIEVRFEKPFKAVGKTPFKLESVSTNQTRVIWGMSMMQKYPMNFMGAIMAPALKRDVDTSLNNLKVILEKNR